MNLTYRQAERSAVEPTPAPSLPLAGIRVMEFSHMVMGPSAGLILADLGADVIKIEPAPKGDATRSLQGIAIGFFSTYNRNKRSLVIDLKTAEGREVIHALARTSDVLIENYSPGTMDRLGCGYEELSALNPGLIYCSLKGFLDGPYAHRVALDEVVQYMGGLAYMTGTPGEPKRAGASVIDIMGGMFGVIAIQAALREREHTGHGQNVKSALFETTAYLMGQHIIRAQYEGIQIEPLAARDRRAGVWTIYEPFTTKDKKTIFLGLISDNHWRRFCDRFAPGAASDPRFSTNADRVELRSEIVPLVENIFAQRTFAEMVQELDHLGCPFAPVATPNDLIDDPHLNAHDRMLRVDVPGRPTARLPRLPLEMHGHQPQIRRQPPSCGENSREILIELGLDEIAIGRLHENGVVVCASGAATDTDTKNRTTPREESQSKVDAAK